MNKSDMKYTKSFIRTQLTRLGVPVYGDEKTKLVDAIYMAAVSNSIFDNSQNFSTDFFTKKMKVNIFGGRSEVVAKLTVIIDWPLLPQLKIKFTKGE